MFITVPISSLGHEYWSSLFSLVCSSFLTSCCVTTMWMIEQCLCGSKTSGSSSLGISSWHLPVDISVRWEWCMHQGEYSSFFLSGKLQKSCTNRSETMGWENDLERWFNAIKTRKWLELIISELGKKTWIRNLGSYILLHVIGKFSCNSRPAEPSCIKEFNRGMKLPQIYPSPGIYSLWFVPFTLGKVTDAYRSRFSISILRSG